MTSPDLAYPPPDEPQPIALSAWDRLRPTVAPIVGWVVSLCCTAFVRSALGVRWNVTEVPVSVQVPLTVALLAIPAKLVELWVATHTNPGNAASPRVAKAMKASSVGSASEGATNLAALAASGARPTAGAARTAGADPASVPVVLPTTHPDEVD